MKNSKFNLIAEYKPQGDQPQAIEKLTKGILRGDKFQTLLGVTGSGKTFTMANVIANVNKPTLVIAHNKTLAAQLCSEFREFFPDNAVGYFVSYYDYYQPEAYVPQTDTYIEKDSAVNEDIDRLRLSATSQLLERNDVIIVASVSCIYGLGSPSDYLDLSCRVEVGMVKDRSEIIRELINIRYDRNDINFTRGAFRVRGDTLEIFPAYQEEAYRIELFGDEIDRITVIDTLTGEILETIDEVIIYPASHFVTKDDKIKVALKTIEQELEERLRVFRSEGKLLEAQRIEQRTRYDLEMLSTIGFCTGIENYSLHLAGRSSGSRPDTLLDYFPDDWLLIIDESHMTIPQIGGMYKGDRSRKEKLVEYGFRLPSALDNRPLRFNEFESLINQVILVSATPRPYEAEHSTQTVEQIIRPTGLVDPEVVVRPVKGQIDDLLEEIRYVVNDKNERILITTLTKRMSEDLTEYLAEIGIAVRYMHSDIDVIERQEIIRDLRKGEFDVLVGINLLREGLDLPEVSLIAILDADKEGFLRGERALIQTIGRAARNVDGRVIMYADKMTDSMRKAIDETNRRQKLQMAFNKEHGIIPKTIVKPIRDVLRPEEMLVDKKRKLEIPKDDEKSEMTPQEIHRLISELEEEMKDAAKMLEFELAAQIRDEIENLRNQL
ncbi:MAG: excinuclease ABC subunit UvrB [Halanaerobiales bacterium]|nr:excinuclease ABC subunit UvrB [Halanaerobiales bacterium]